MILLHRWGPGFTNWQGANHFVSGIVAGKGWCHSQLAVLGAVPGLRPKSCRYYDAIYLYLLASLFYPHSFLCPCISGNTS